MYLLQSHYLPMKINLVMAENKNSFVLYTDIIHTVNKLPDDKAGQLFKHLLCYVNDQNPKTKDLVIEVAFEPIKQSLKRDLKKYELILKKKSHAGKLSAEKRKADKKIIPKKTPIKGESDEINRIFAHWNSKQIIKHSKISSNITKEIKKALKTYSHNEIGEYIDRYSKVLNDNNYFFNYKWTLIEFLTRAKGISSFTNEGSKWSNYLQETKTNQYTHVKFQYPNSKMFTVTVNQYEDEIKEKIKDKQFVIKPTYFKK